MSDGSSSSPAWQWLHGDLELTIHEARGLPNMDLLSSILRRLCLCPPPLPWITTPPTTRRGRSLSSDDDTTAHAHPHPHLRGRLHRHHRHHDPQPHGHLLLATSDPYTAVVVVGPHETTVARTFVFRNSESPKWESTFLLHLAHAATGLEFHVKDADPFGSDLIGVASLPAAAVLAATATAAGGAPIVSQWLHLARPDGRRISAGGTAIRISATFVPAAAAAAARKRRSGGDDCGVPAYFPLRRGCDVRLYQDAHVAPGEVDGVGGGGRCWEDLCMAVLCAQRLVYVAGWSVHTRVHLLQEAMSPEMAAKVAEVEDLGGEPVENMSLGELLKYKSQEGVRVLLLVWDDKASQDNFFLKTVQSWSDSD